MARARQSNRPLSRSQLVRLRDNWARRKAKVVFTNGVFDILHVGHVELLSKAKSFGDVLVVGVNSDASVCRLKGPSRPINSQRDRCKLLLALSMVDAVCVFNEDTPLELIQALRPDVLVKGSEYSVSKIVGAAEVRSWGGRVRRVKMKPGYSTTAIIRRAGIRK